MTDFSNYSTLSSLDTRLGLCRYSYVHNGCTSLDGLSGLAEDQLLLLLIIFQLLLLSVVLSLVSALFDFCFPFLSIPLCHILLVYGDRF